MAARPLVTRPPNERLQTLINEAGCSNVGLARRVNAEGAHRGLDLRYDKTSVSRWLRGQQPRGQTPAIIAEMLSRRLGRTVSVEEIGMAGGKEREVSGIGLTFAPGLSHAIDEVTDLWRSDANRRTMHAGSRLAISALLEPSRDWLIAEPDTTVLRNGGRPVGAADIELMARTTEYVTDLDHRFGSGHVRPIALHYLSSVASVLLKGSYDGKVGPQLCAATARLTELAGYMAVDNGKPGLALRYYIQALRLAQAAGDRAYGGYVLAAGMSHLAASLGHPREVVQLARTAREGTRGHAGLTTQACLLAAEARGYALVGDGQACTAAMGKAVDALDRADPADDPDWVAHFDRAYLADELAHCYLDLKQPKAAARNAEQALAGHPEHRVRRRAIDLLVLATAQVQAREVDQACATAMRAVHLLARLRSRLAVDYLKTFRSRLKPYAEHPAVRDFEGRLHEEAARAILGRSEEQLV